MADNLVLPVTLDSEEAVHVQNPGLLTKIHLMATTLFLHISRRIPALGLLQSPGGRDDSKIITDAGASSDDQGAVSEPPLPAEISPGIAAPNSHRNRVEHIYLHPVAVRIREQELGKSILGLGAPITMALYSREKPQTVLDRFVLAGLSAGCSAIWNGMALRGSSPAIANMVEQIGIVMVLASFNCLVASSLPIEFAWVPMLSGAFPILPLAIATLPHEGDAANGSPADVG
ncbi:UNVERIFIED_CONTAM: hypothetical protein Slati_1906200 [Sesamum latifolium]|uniref:PIN-like protein n=1 Tax=Sesamum latifolium TaxID=2727402 RepID=A0AAW2X1X1_9LAMI